MPLAVIAIDPIYDYGRGNGDFQGGAIVGGYVYRGPDPELQGTYFFADTVSGNIWSMIPGDPPMVDNIEADLPPDAGILQAKVSFGEDAAGNLYIINLGSSSFQPPLGTGSVYRIITDAVILPGDYNQSGGVDAADYTVWRNNLGAPAGTLPNDVDGGTIGAAQYATWKANFGSTAGSGALTIATVPEPGMMVLLMLAATVWLLPARLNRTSAEKS